MSDSGYMPSTEEIREYVIVGDPSPWEAPSQEVDARERRRGEAFDRWLAAHDAVIRADEREKAINVIRFHRGGYNRNGANHRLLHKMENAIRGQSFTGTEEQK